MAQLGRRQKKEKAALISLSVLGWLLAVLPAFYPGMPGPTQAMDLMFRPLGKLLEK